MISRRTYGVVAALGFALTPFDGARAQDQCVELPAGTASISGQVTSEATGTGVSAQVIARAEIDGFGTAVIDEFTGLGGSYALQVPAPATYVLTAEPSNASFAPEYYNAALSQETATVVNVSPGEIVLGVNFTLVAASTISGTVTAEGSGDPIASVSASIKSLNGLPGGNALTDANGDYVVAGLAEGPHTIVFFPNATATDFLTEVYDDEVQLPGDVVNVTAPGVSGIDAELELGGRVEGTVTGAGVPLQFAGVGGVSSTGLFSIGAITDAAGNYSLLAPAGSLKVLSGYVGFVTEYYDDQPDETAATPVLVNTSTTTSGIDIDLSRSGAITGTVTDSGSGDPLQSVIVFAYDATGAAVSIASTNGAGSYRLETELPSGDYRLKFVGPLAQFGGSPGYATRYYLNKATLAGATPVSVTAPDTTPNIDQALTSCDQVIPSTSTTTSTTSTTVAETTTTTIEETTTTTSATTTTTLGGIAECGDPVAFVAGASRMGTAAAVTATDALFVLRAAVAIEQCVVCVCDVDDSGSVSATDALIVLQSAVGQPVELQCPPC